MKWTDQRIAVLKRMAAAGATFSEVALAIGEGCTRNMVAGKAKRLEVSFPVSTAKLSRVAALSWRSRTPEQAADWKSRAAEGRRRYAAARRAAA